MKHLLFLFCLFCLLIIASSIHAESGDTHINFTESYLSGRELSQKLDKPLVVYFYEENNDACTEMKTVWQDEKVAEIIARKFIISKVNIHYFDGETLRKYHKIQTAPAIIILAPSGTVLRRINTSLTQGELLAFLQGSASSSSSRTSDISATQPTPQARETSISTSEPATSLASTTTSSSSTTIQPATTLKYSAPVQSDKPSSSENSIATEAPAQKYTIQVGAFSTTENAQSRKTQLERIFNEPVFVVKDKESENPLYRVLVGDFTVKNKASNYLQLVKKYGVNGFVKAINF